MEPLRHWLPWLDTCPICHALVMFLRSGLAADTIRTRQADKRDIEPGSCSATIRVVAALPRLRCSRRLIRCLT